MYDDYDLDYTYAPEYTYDLDETYDMWVQSFAHTSQLDEDLDEEYARDAQDYDCLLYTSPSPRDYAASRMPSSA